MAFRIAAVVASLAACTGGGAPAGGGMECEGAKCDALIDASPAGGDGAPAGCAEEMGSLPAAWIRGGPDCGEEPDIQVHRYGASTFILRQSLCTSFEAPFLYLLFGEDRVLL